MTNLKIYVNCDTDDLPLDSSGVDFVEMSVDNDKLIFSDGSDTVKDGESIPSESDYNRAGTLIDAVSDVEVDKCFLEDASAVLLKEIHNYKANKRYVFAFSFDGETSSEPILELFDDDEFDSIDLYSLGEGVASDSWWRGVVTTSGLPGVDWTGIKLAGDGDGHFLYLNDEAGALSEAKVLYANFKVVLPAGGTHSGSELPVFVIKYTSN